MLVATLIASTAEMRRQQSDRFWQGLSVVGLEAEWYDDLLSVARGADAIVSGRLISIGPGREFGTEDVGRVFTAWATVEIERPIEGRASSTLIVEFLLPNPKQLPMLQDDLPQERTLFFLRNKGDEAAALGMPSETVKAESQFYRLVTSETLFRDLGGDAVPRPGHESQLARGVAGTPFEELVSDVSELVAH